MLPPPPANNSRPLDLLTSLPPSPHTIPGTFGQVNPAWTRSPYQIISRMLHRFQMVQQLFVNVRRRETNQTAPPLKILRVPHFVFFNDAFDADRRRRRHRIQLRLKRRFPIRRQRLEQIPAFETFENLRFAQVTVRRNVLQPHFRRGMFRQTNGALAADRFESLVVNVPCPLVLRKISRRRRQRNSTRS